MPRPTVIGPGGGEVIGDSADRRVEVLSDHDGLHATWARFAAGRDGAGLHVHRHHTDLFYVLDGELTLRLGTEGEEVVVPQGRLAAIPPLVVHGFRNGGAGEVRYLNLHAPGCGFIDYLRALVRDGTRLECDMEDPPSQGARPTSDATVGEPHAEVDGLRMSHATLPAGAPLAAGTLKTEVLSLYVLDGELEATLGEEVVPAGPGTWIQVPEGTPHAARAREAGPASVLVLRTPA